MPFRPVIHCEGGPHDRGESHGAQAAELIHDNVETYRRLLRARFGIEWAAARRHAARFVPWIQEFDAGLAEELRALAAGARADARDIVLLNARSSLTLTRSPDDCTAIASLPAAAHAGATMLAQNWDNLRRLRAVVLQVATPGSSPLVTLTEAGTLAKIGLNGDGVGIAVNGLHGPAAARRAVPIFVTLRKALEAPTLGRAMEILTGTVKDAPHHYLVASGEGAAFSIEALADDHDILAPAGPFLVHTNHYVGPRLLARPTSRVRHPDSVVRLWRAQRLLAGHRGPFGVAEAREVLGDHFGAPGSICRHAGDGADDLAGETKCCVVMELAASRMHVSEGHPCKTPFETITVGVKWTRDG